MLVGGVLAVAVPGWRSWRADSHRQQCKANLKVIGLALHEYHDKHGSFPPAYVVDSEGKRMHSWRVLILRELGHESLFARYRLDEPWDGPNNQKLTAEMPAVFGCPADSRRKRGVTNYVAVVGPQTIWPEQYAASIQHVIDGTSNTLFVVDSCDLHPVWTEPRDLSREEVLPGLNLKQSPSFSSRHDGGAQTLMADGIVRFINQNINLGILRALCNMASGAPFPGVAWKLPVEFADDEISAPLSAADLKQTTVQPCLDVALATGQNMVYCATFQITWDDLRDMFHVGAVELKEKPELAKQLNAVRFPKASLADDSYLALVGRFEDDILGKIAAERQRKFPNANLPLPQPPGDFQVVAYCYLQKRLPFTSKFDKLPTPLRFQTPQGETPVVSFGIQTPKSTEIHEEILRGQVEVLDYFSDDDFVLRLKTQSDWIVLAKLPPKETLEQTWQTVVSRIRKPLGGVTPPPLLPDERFIVPQVALFVERDYHELLGSTFENLPGCHTLIGAKQYIKFQLDESGAKLESGAETIGDSGPAGPPRPPKPRHFVFDRPFLLALQQQNAEQPYFVMWIANAELLVSAR
jgi:hypothetical protein